MKRAFVSLVIFFFFIKAEAVFPQILKVQGNISTSKVSVSNASITFINENDITKKYSALTDSTGNYRLTIGENNEEN